MDKDIIDKMYMGDFNVDDDDNSFIIDVELLHIKDAIKIVKQDTDVQKERFINEIVGRLERAWEEAEDDESK